MSETQLPITKKEFYAGLQADWVAQSGLTEADFMKEVSFAIQHINKTPLLFKCERNSILRAVINLAQVGLTLNPISKLAYLIPRWNAKASQFEAALEPDYRGLIKLLTDAGSITSLTCELIYEGDDVVIDKADPNKVKKHTPYFLNGKEKGRIVAVYSLATLPDGSKHFEGMGYSEVMEIRDRSESYKAFKDGKTKSCIWVTDEGEMCRKTVIKRHSKYLPKSNSSDKLNTAIDLDNQLNGFREEMDFGMLSFLESSILNSTLNPDRQSKLLKDITQMHYKDEAYKLIDELQQAQPIMGRDVVPHTIADQKKAIDYSVAKDDFHEERFGKK